MKTSDQIIIEELKRIVLMQSQEITQLITKINVLERSEGGLHFLLNRLASKGVDAYEMIRQNVMRSRVIGTDETGVKNSFYYY